MGRIAVIDDDIHIGDMLEEVLRREGYEVLRAYSGTEALLLLRGQRPDLILLDLMLPGLSGEEVLPHLAGIPVIVLSARADVRDKVSLLLGGAADYLTKPFDTRELLARIAVRLRESSAPGLAPVLEAGLLRLDQIAHTVTAADQPVRLTKTEYAILKLFLQNPGQVIAKSVILDRISADTPDCTESSLKIHISNLRKKLRDTTGQEHIESVWGIGFKLNTFEVDQHV
ncbi:MAG: response regulator transcription factor [Lawsonibacter sp.]|nr:response regulator transcription factor [Lawsonibacter sp.]